jgi:stage V sporulation protein R
MSMQSHALPPELRELQARAKAAADKFGLDTFEVIFEMLDYDQINQVAAGGGFPKRYPHWRFGMSYDQLSKGYEWGMQKIYEMVINTHNLVVQ